MFNMVVLRDRPELKLTLGTVLMFPFYRTWCLIFRLYSLLRNIIMYSTWVRKFVRISVREQDMHDIPPVPYVTNPDWYTIWHASKSEEDSDSVRLLGFPASVVGGAAAHVCHLVWAFPRSW